MVSGVHGAHCATLEAEVVMRTTVHDWEDQWSAPESPVERVAPWVALALAVLVTLI